MTCRAVPVGSASDAAAYYAKDNYYSEGEKGPSEWSGKGAEALGLVGEVKTDIFERILSGALPNGDQIKPGANGEHRPGDDLTFSAPKSVSLVALVGGDRRVIEAQMNAVRTTMAWVEERLAVSRSGAQGKDKEHTGNLVYAAFSHDLSRKLDPQLHTHVVVANATQRSDGSWLALSAAPLYYGAPLIGAAYHAELRSELGMLGYQTELTGKHGQFEIIGMPRETIEAFSERHLQIRAKADELGLTSQKALGSIAERTRDVKQMGDAETARSLWAEKAKEHGRTITAVVTAALAPKRGPSLIAAVRSWGETILARAFAPRSDPLLEGTERMGKGTTLANALVVAAGANHLAERQSSFRSLELVQAALAFAQHGVTVRGIEARIAELEAMRILVRSPARDGSDWLTTKDLIATDRKLLAAIADGQGRGTPSLTADTAARELARSANEDGIILKDEQIAAGVAMLSGSDRVMVLQGSSGTGKSTLFAYVREVLEAKGGQILGLVPQNKLMDELAPSGLQLRSVQSILTRFEGVARGQRTTTNAARQELGGKLLIVDESSMVSSRQMLGLLSIAEKASVAKVVLVGDRRQISPVEAGQPFALAQDQGAPMTEMIDNRRQRPDDLRAAVAAAREGDAEGALEHLGERVRECARPHEAAAAAYLSMSPQQRSGTAILTSGHVLRQLVLNGTREGLIAEGVLGKRAVTLDVLANLNLTREQLREVSSYHEGQVLDVYREEQDLERGRYEVAGVDRSTGRVELELDGKSHTLRPAKLHHNGKGLTLSAPRQIEVRQGDQLIWTANDAKRGMVNGMPTEVIAIGEDGTLHLRGKNRDHELRPDDPARTRLDHGLVLNMHRAQGITVDTAIAVMSSEDRQLNSKELFYVLSSRARDDLQLFTDDAARLADRIAQHDGSAPHAIELAKELERTVRGERFDPKTGEIIYNDKEWKPPITEADLERLSSALKPPEPARPEPEKVQQKELALEMRDRMRGLEEPDMDLGL